MHQKNIFVILGCCGIPIMLYALVCLAVASYTFLTYIFTFFYMRLGKLIFKTLWLFGVLVLAVYIDYFFIIRGEDSISFIIYVLVYMSTSMVISCLLKRYVDRQ